MIDASKGVEAQTRKLFKVCVMRHIPIFTIYSIRWTVMQMIRLSFLMILKIELGIATYPVNWPIGSGKEFKGVYDRHTRKVMTFADTLKGTKKVPKRLLISMIRH